ALMYEGVDGGLMGRFALFVPDDAAALASGDFSAGHATSAGWFFQVVFVATAASIVSGTLAERIRILPFFLFVAMLTAFIYPVAGAWSWGGGWLAGLGFSDFAGSTVVHSVGGWAALAGALLLGPRLGRYGALGEVRVMPGSNLPLATLGTFILWLGWFGFNGASRLAFRDAADAVAVSQIFANTNMAAVGGVLAAILATRLRFGRVDLTMALNGALAGLVSITAEPTTPTMGEAMLIGAAGGLFVVLLVPLLDRLHVDDVVGAIPVHLGAGIWGTLAAALTNPDVRLATQLLGILAIGAFVFLASGLVWLLLRTTIGLRLAPEDEFRGGDVSELGLEAYPEFGRGSQAIRN
ncbi:MAG: ammonium transporter, partial [Rhodothalassiaceae bacterium]